MGLAATQARFLAITSRKANCEFRTMELAQQKLSLSRQMEDATIDYNNALEASKIIWDVDGTGQYRYNLSYDVMMQPSDLNQYLPYLVSRQDGKIAVDDKMKAALTGVVQDDGGIWYDNGSGVATLVYYGDQDYEAAKQAAYNQFIEGLAENRAIPQSIKTKLFDGTNYSYFANAGIGEELFQREVANMMSFGNMISWINNVISMVSSNQFADGTPEAELAKSLIFDFGDPTGSEHYFLGRHEKADGATNIYLNREHFSDGLSSPTSPLACSQYTLTLSDLLQSNVTMTLLLNCDSANGRNCRDSYNEAINSILNYAQDNLSTILSSSSAADWYDNTTTGAAHTYSSLQAGANAQYGSPNDDTYANAAILNTVNFIDKLIRGMWNLLMPDSDDTMTGINASPENESAFMYAMQSLIKSFRINSNNWVELKSGDARREKCEFEAKENADKYNCWTKYKGAYAMSLSNLTEAFLTNFVNGLDNYQDGCLITKNASSSVYITDDPSYLYRVNLTEEPEERLWEAEFYSIIFNNICSSGWYENQKLNDNAYLNSAIKNGQLFITSLNEQDYNYYQTRYAQVHGGHIVEETDEDAVAQAEREYTYIKNKINYKEQRIEVETKSIDAELLSLNTEYETVKNLISKSIDNTFKQFQS